MNNEKSLVERVYDILKDGQPHRSDIITSQLFGTSDTIKTGLFRLGARIWDVKKKYSVEIIGKKDKINPKLYWYQIKVEQKVEFAPRVYSSNQNQGQLPMALPRIFA